MIAGKTPLGDIDYQKNARNTVVGELNRYFFYYALTFLSLYCHILLCNIKKYKFIGFSFSKVLLFLVLYFWE